MRTVEHKDGTTTLFSLKASEIVEAISSAAESNEQIKELHEHLQSFTTDEQRLDVLCKSREFLKLVYTAGGFRSFTFAELKADKDWLWTLRLKFPVDLPKLHHVYNLHFCFNPLPYFNNIRDIEAEIKDVQSNPTLLPEEDAEKIERLRERLTHQERVCVEHFEACEDITFTATVSECKYREGTLVAFTIPPHISSVLNDHRLDLREYQVRMEHLS